MWAGSVSVTDSTVIDYLDKIVDYAVVVCRHCVSVVIIYADWVLV